MRFLTEIADSARPLGPGSFSRPWNLNLSAARGLRGRSALYGGTGEIDHGKRLIRMKPGNRVCRFHASGKAGMDLFIGDLKRRAFAVRLQAIETRQ